MSNKLAVTYVWMGNLLARPLELRDELRNNTIIHKKTV